MIIDGPWDCFNMTVSSFPLYIPQCLKLGGIRYLNSYESSLTPSNAYFLLKLYDLFVFHPVYIYVETRHILFLKMKDYDWSLLKTCKPRQGQSHLSVFQRGLLSSRGDWRGSAGANYASFYFSPLPAHSPWYPGEHETKSPLQDSGCTMWNPLMSIGINTS